MNFVYEDLPNRMNLLSSNVEVNGDNFLSKYFRFNNCPITNDINDLGNINYTAVKYLGPREYTIKKRPRRYIIPVGLNKSPNEWIGGYDKSKGITGKDYIFDYLRPEYLKDLQTGRAFLLLDSSLEGYHTDTIFDYLHSQCGRNKISPTQIIFISGNMLLEQNYTKWFYSTDHEDSIHCLGYPHFELEVYKNLWERKYREFIEIIDFDSHMVYKQENYIDIKLYSCTNKRPRPHRIALFKGLVENDLLNKGVVSMDYFEPYDIKEEGFDIKGEELEKLTPLLPRYPYGISLNAKPTSYYIKRFNEKHALDSWVNVVSEARYSDEEKTVFLSEKIFKAIALQQPFIVVGSKNTLKYLKKLGYKTFSEHFDESYDELEDTERISKVLEVLNSIDTIEDKLSWYEKMKPIFEHNSYQLQHHSTKDIMPQYKSLLNHYFR